ncbi:MAG TPA: ATP-binding protein [Puia sp.]|jgi:hypothetical protein
MSRTTDTPPDNDVPNPEYLIKSIAEQGYSLETALADLIDNSITAGAGQIEILADTATEPFVLFLADDGGGMNEDTLALNMKFPSSSPEDNRRTDDLGRFGLGMKTASFSQTRTFTVLSRKKGTEAFHGRTWDVDYLRREKEWKILKNTPEEVSRLLAQYTRLSNGFLNPYKNYAPNTIVIWQGLYKFENSPDNNRQAHLQKEITEITSEYLSLVFHRYMERKINALTIRVNNNVLIPFNPFPSGESDFRRLETSHRLFREDALKIEGYVLPSRSLDESKNGSSVWTPSNKSLMDMEGLYIYRADRIILFGGWNGIIKKAPRLQLARLKVEIGNSVDHYFHLNVAKSSIAIPYELKVAFLRYVSELKTQSEKEYHNRGITKMARTKQRTNSTLFLRRATSKGALLELNEDFPVIQSLKRQLTEDQNQLFRLITKMVNTNINKFRQVYENKSFMEAGREDLTEEEIIRTVRLLRESGFDQKEIEELLSGILGLRTETIPMHILNS